MRDPELTRQWDQDGYVLLKQVVPHDLIDRYNAEVAGFRRTCGETKDEHGFGQRIGLFHAKSPTGLAIAQNPEVRSFLRWVFREEAVLFGSLTFEAGTEQAAHQDSIFFFTQPEYAMAGAWVALEDVHPEAGPLFYYPGSHLWGVERAEAVWQARPDLHAKVQALAAWAPKQAEARAQLAGELGNVWSELLAKRIADHAVQPVQALVKKGDALLWHAHLVHGGSPRKNRKLSRRSLVTHHTGLKALMFDMSTFFLKPANRFDAAAAMPRSVRDHPLGPFVPHAKPVTY